LFPLSSYLADFKRFQTKYRRRREGKTDYRARKRLTAQDKNKYNSPKYRLVVRITNTQCICQIVYPAIVGDKVLTSAYSSELPRYGLKAGLKNYAACYCTGLLLARRTLLKLGLDKLYEGNDEVTGEIVKTEMNGRVHFVEEVNDDKRPFRAFLDVGTQTCTTGNRVFGALKGAADGGLDVPHSEKRFPGYDADGKSYDADTHKARIFGEHVADYMSELQEEDPTEYAKQFADYIKNDMNADNLEEIITAVHEAIRADPAPTAKPDMKVDKQYKKSAKKTYEQRKADVEAKKAALEEEEDEDEDDEEEEEEEDDE